MTDKVITRFAPSPTGFMHIGTARTGLFNWLFAKHTNGECILRIEDTDKERSTQEATDALIEDFEWLGLDFDGETVMQSTRADRHSEVALQLVKEDKAYYCTCSKEELETMREEQKSKGLVGYNGKCRDAGHATGVVRIKSPNDDGDMTINDIVQGDVKVPHAQLDDFVLLRTDGSPTYMLSVVVDDHDMEVTHICRGDDHLNNAFRQSVIYNALGWDVPKFAHVPLIHGPDGGKMSKRHGAASVGEYRDMGYLPEAVNNYLLRLGWGHGDLEIVPMEEAIKLFTLEAIGKSPSRMDFDKFKHVNAHYMREMKEAELIKLLIPFLEKEIDDEVSDAAKDYLKAGMADLKERASTLIELATEAAFYARPRPIMLNEKASGTVDDNAREILAEIKAGFETMDDFSVDNIKGFIKELSKAKDVKMGKVAMPLRAVLTGTTSSPSIFHVAEILGKEEVIARISDNI